MTIDRQHLHQATQYLKQLKVQLVDELPHEAEYGLHLINRAISTGIINNTTEIKIDLPTRTFLFFHKEEGQTVDLRAHDAGKQVQELIEQSVLDVPDTEFPNIPRQEFDEVLSYAEEARRYLEQFRLRLDGTFSFNHLWGHNFDFSVVSYLGGDAQVSVGISPGDEYSEQPYLYVTPWPVDDSVTKLELAVGQWWTEEWTGIMVGWDELQDQDDVVGLIVQLYDLVKGATSTEQ